MVDINLLMFRKNNKKSFSGEGLNGNGRDNSAVEQRENSRGICEVPFNTHDCMNRFIIMTERHARLAPESVGAAVAVLVNVSRSGRASSIEGRAKDGVTD
jgi:hypothetical protein